MKALSAAAVALFVLAMHWLSGSWSQPVAEPHAMLPYWAGFALLWAVLTRLPLRGARRDVVLIVAVALFARLAVALATQPVLSDDIWRYIHDGYVLGVQQRSPYAWPPLAHNPLGLPINHPHLVTIYQPVSQIVFAALALLGRETVFRLGFIVADLVAIALLLGALRRQGRSPWLAAIYAWHPLAISEVAGSGHQEPIGIALLLFAILSLERGRALPSAFAMAMAIAVKPIIAPLVLPMAWMLRGEPRKLTAALVVGSATLAALYLPFALTTAGLRGLLATSLAFVETWSGNASLHALLAAAIGHTGATRVALLTLLALLVIWTIRNTPLRQVVLFYLLASLLLSSTVHPWYVLWPLALLPLCRPGRAWWATWTLGLTVTIAYTAHLRPDTGHPWPWAVALEYLPIYAALLIPRITHHPSSISHAAPLTRSAG